MYVFRVTELLGSPPPQSLKGNILTHVCIFRHIDMHPKTNYCVLKHAVQDIYMHIISFCAWN